jgi:hypothetical protein
MGNLGTKMTPNVPVMCQSINCTKRFNPSITIQDQCGYASSRRHINIIGTQVLQQVYRRTTLMKKMGSFVKIHRTNKPVLKHKIKLLKKNLLTDISIFDVAEISATATPEVQASTSALTSSRNTGFPNVLCASLGAIK